MKDVSRREVIAKMVAGGAGVALMFTADDVAKSAETLPARAFRGQHQPRPLPFDPAKLKGLSEKLIRSHWENNYGGAVKALNAVEQRLAAMLTEKELPAYMYGDLKREELARSGSVVLHELYFANLGGDPKPGGKVLDVIKQWFGSYEQWEDEFKKTANALGGGSGWGSLRTMLTQVSSIITGPGTTCTTFRWVVHCWCSTCTNTPTTWTTAPRRRSMSTHSCRT